MTTHTRAKQHTRQRIGGITEDALLAKNKMAKKDDLAALVTSYLGIPTQPKYAAHIIADLAANPQTPIAALLEIAGDRDSFDVTLCHHPAWKRIFRQKPELAAKLLQTKDTSAWRGMSRLLRLPLFAQQQLGGLPRGIYSKDLRGHFYFYPSGLIAFGGLWPHGTPDITKLDWAPLFFVDKAALLQGARQGLFTPKLVTIAPQQVAKRVAQALATAEAEFLAKKGTVSGRVRVGARNPSEIQADPQATAAEVQTLPPLLAIAHPNCPEALWWSLAEKHPIEAQESILFPLIMLENPGRWEQVERKWAHLWVEYAITRLPTQARRPFAIDCAERVLSIFEREWDEDSRPRLAIEAAKNYVRGKETKANLAAACAAAHEACADANDAYVDAEERGDPNADDDYVAMMAAGAAAYAADVDVAFERQASGHAAGARRGDEFVWQLHRLQDYLRGEVSLVGTRRGRR